MEADLKRGSKSDESRSEDDGRERSTKGSRQKSDERGRSLLEAERARYKARAEQIVGRSGASATKGASAGIEFILEGFRRKLRSAEPLSKSDTHDADRLDGYAGEVDPTLNGVLGDVDDDDQGCMSQYVVTALRSFTLT